MKRFSIILKYLRDQRSQVALYFFFNLLSILFSLVSLAMLAPFLQLLFGKEKLLTTAPVFHFSANGILQYIKYYLSHLIQYHGEIYALIAICGIVVAAIFLKNVFLYLSYRVLGPMRNSVMLRLRNDLYAKILHLPLGYFSEQRKGDISSRMSNDMNEIEWSVISTMEGLIKEPLNILLIFVALIFLSPLLSLFLAVLLPVTGFVIGRISRSMRKQSGIAQEQLGVLMSIVEETLGGLRVIKAFTAEPAMQKKFEDTNAYLTHIKNRIIFRRDMASPLSEFLGVIVLACVLLFGGQLVLGHHTGMQADAFITYIVFFTQIINPAKSFSTAFYNIQKGSAAIQRIEAVLKAPLVVEDAPNARTLQGLSEEIRFEAVGFQYEGTPVLEGIELAIPKGKTIALVGASGAGKSTLADLVPRFHDVTEGVLKVDGLDIRQYSLLSLRNQISIVTQEPILFNDTIAANIALGNPEASLDQIIQAAQVANAHEFIVKKEKGYQTNIGDRGSKLSGGERQRLTIARAVLKNPPILILDEATSSLDTESERLVQDAINRMMRNRTTLVIAHRLSTIQHADEIIVMQSGRIVERGTHEQLLGLGGFYKRLVDMQALK